MATLDERAKNPTGKISGSGIHIASLSQPIALGRSPGCQEKEVPEALACSIIGSKAKDSLVGIDLEADDFSVGSVRAIVLHDRIEALPYF